MQRRNLVLVGISFERFSLKGVTQGGRIRVRRKLLEAKMRRHGTGGGKGNISPPQGGYIFSWVGGKISGEAGSASTCFLATKQTTAHTGSVMTLHFEPPPSPPTPHYFCHHHHHHHHEDDVKC